MSNRNPMKDQVAIVGVASTGYTRETEGRSQSSLALEACANAIRDAGIAKAEVDGVAGTSPHAPYVAAALGLSGVRSYTTEMTPFGQTVIQAAQAIHAGSCDVALAYHSVYRTAMTSKSAAADPFRRSAMAGLGANVPRDAPDRMEGAVAYAAYASRYLHETGTTREQLGHVAVSDRINGCLNPLAVMQKPLSMEEYLAARMIREPLCLFDMDVPVDGADALVLTTAERAADICEKPVLIHATSTGLPPVGGYYGGETQLMDLHHHGQHVVIADLRARSDLWIDDVDVYFPYDGFSFITLAWIENAGWCDFGEAGQLIEDSRDASGRILLNGRIPVNPHGGAISEGATQGAGHIREAVLQLRGDAGQRQVSQAKTALVTPGGFFFNSQGLVLRTA